MIRIRLFGKFSDLIAGGDELSVSAETITCVEDIFRYCAEKIPTVYAQISEPQVMVAVNQEIVSREAAVKDGDEVAFLPPVTGG